MDGLIHISELSWSHVNHPSEVLEIGQDVKVKVLDIDRDRQRISLGLKQTQSDPVAAGARELHEGDVVEGSVTKVVTFGAFVEILPGVEGLVHISELAQHHVENPREVVSQGDAVNAKIIEVDAERRRLSLSLKRVEGGGVVRARRRLGARRGTPRSTSRKRSFPRSHASPRPSPTRGAAAETGCEPRRRRDAEAARGLRDRSRSTRAIREPELVEHDAASRRTPAPDEPGPGDSEGEPPRRPGSESTEYRVATGRGRDHGGIGREERGASAFARHGAATISSDDIVHRLREDATCRAALLERFGSGSSTTPATSIRAAIARIVFHDRRRSQWLEACCTRVVGDYLAWREQLGRLADPPAVS
jgi:predicted RNA-binding protein with RPS1 domain